MPSEFTGTIAGNRYYSTGATEGSLLYSCSAPFFVLLYPSGYRYSSNIHKIAIASISAIRNRALVTINLTNQTSFRHFVLPGVFLLFFPVSPFCFSCFASASDTCGALGGIWEGSERDLGGIWEGFGRDLGSGGGRQGSSHRTRVLFLDLWPAMYEIFDVLLFFWY